MDAIKGMSVSKLRKKEESNIAIAKIQKKEEQKKPVSLQDDLKARLMRRNKLGVYFFIFAYLYDVHLCTCMFIYFCSAISGKSDKEQQLADAAIVQAARQEHQQSMLLKGNVNNIVPKPPPPPARGNTGLQKVGFVDTNDR
jgi:hypothetical protein